MVITPALALWIALLVGAVVVVAEVVHHRRIGRISHADANWQSSLLC